MLPGIPGSARCVQRFDDSLNSAIHITYRISLRSSSMREPSDPLLKVVFNIIVNQQIQKTLKWFVVMKEGEAKRGSPSEVHKCGLKWIARRAHVLSC